MTEFTYAHLRGQEEMRARVVAALVQAFAREAAYDQCDRDTACPQCDVWYRVIESVEAVTPENPDLAVEA